MVHSHTATRKFWVVASSVQPYDLQDLRVSAPSIINLDDNMCCHALLHCFFVLNGRYVYRNCSVSQSINHTVSSQPVLCS